MILSLRARQLHNAEASREEDAVMILARTRLAIIGMAVIITAVRVALTEANGRTEATDVTTATMKDERKFMLLSHRDSVQASVLTIWFTTKMLQEMWEETTETTTGTTDMSGANGEL